MNKENVLTLKIIGNQDADDFLPKNEITAAQKELIRFIAITAVEEYRRVDRIEMGEQHPRLCRL